MTDAKAEIRRRLTAAKTFLAGENSPRLSESDTKANFIEPIIAALGWEGIGVVTREYYVRNSQEFIDYVMTGPSGFLLAIEAKPLQTQLNDKHAAQLIQYCAVEGIEWAALTNGRELQFFNSFLKPDLAAKRILRLDLLAFNNDAEFDALFSQIWQLSRESMAAPRAMRSWLNQRRLDTALRSAVLDSSSPVVKYLRRMLSDDEIDATAQDVALWFRTQLGQPLAVLHLPQSHETHVEGSLVKSVASERESRATTGPASKTRTSAYYGVTLRDLIEAGHLQVGTKLTLVASAGREVAHAKLTDAGEIEWEDRLYSSPSAKAFAALLGRQSLNGWTHWRVPLAGGSTTLAEIRSRIQSTDRIVSSNEPNSEAG